MDSFKKSLLIALGLVGTLFNAQAQISGTPISPISSKQVAKQLRHFLPERVSARFPNGQPCEILMTYDPLASDSYLITMSDGKSYTPKQSIRLYARARWFPVRTKILGGTTTYLYLENSRDRDPNSIFVIARSPGADFDLKIHANGQEVTCNYRE
jgi:hypothetical protein